MAVLSEVHSFLNLKRVLDCLAERAGGTLDLAGSLPDFGSRIGALECELGLNTLDTVSRIDVLDHRDLVAGGGALAGDDGRIGKEVFPDLDRSENVWKQTI